MSVAQLEAWLERLGLQLAAIWETCREILPDALIAADTAILTYFFAINLQYLALLLIGYRATLRVIRFQHPRDELRLIQSPLARPISVIVPSYNEEANIVASVRSLMLLRYPRFEIVVVNDGSRDRTLQRLIEAFELSQVSRSYDNKLPAQPIRAVYESAKHKDLVVIDKDNGGKSDALNAGLNVAIYPLYCAIDGDSLLEPDALLRVARPFVEDREGTVASGGIIRIANGCEIERAHVVTVRVPRNALAGIQVVEYLRAFLFGRMGWSSLGALVIIAGAFGLFDKKTVIEAGGYRTDTVGEDLELVVRLHQMLQRQGRRGRFSYVPEPVCWTEAPETFRDLSRQRSRWQRGLAEVLWRYRSMIGRPRFGVVGTIALPAQVLFELLAPFVELLGWILIPASLFLGLLDSFYLASFLVVAVLYSILVSIAAIMLEEFAFRRYAKIQDLIRLGILAIIENVGYRQLNNWWRLRGLWDAFRGRSDWGEMTRKGMSTPHLEFGGESIDRSQ